MALQPHPLNQYHVFLDSPGDVAAERQDDRAVQDLDESVRSEACCALGKMHSEFGRILPTRDLDGYAPYLDPLKPISRDHIEKAAKKVGIAPEDIDAQVASLSAHLGWDITVGAKSRMGPLSRPRRSC